MRMVTSGDLWVGTDNGLYIYSPSSGQFEYLVHSSRDGRSLINNAIWGIFEDREYKSGWEQTGESLCTGIPPLSVFISGKVL